MNTFKFRLFALIFSATMLWCSNHAGHSQSWIRINQLGYVPASIKVAVLVSKDDIDCARFSLHDAATKQEVWSSNSVQAAGGYGPFVRTFRLDFSRFDQPGDYYIKTNAAASPVFPIGADVYAGAADFLLLYMRQQRCGFNPFLNDSCHTHDGFTIYGPIPDGTPIDAIGGWHDAGDYLQYVTTSANATYHLLFAYRENPASFGDEFSANGLPGKNGLADVLDEAKWGLDWLLKMHPREDWMFNQIADDRDHAGWRLPNQDTTKYGVVGLARPVYFCNGQPQGLFRYKNRTTGAASTAGKFAAAFALGAEIFSEIDPDYARHLATKAASAYRFGEARPGVCQTAPCRAPYFYEEDNWVDDMELGAAALFALTEQPAYFDDALNFSRDERVTPWMGADTARHYQWYPFMNLGHFELARNASEATRTELAENYQEGLRRTYARGKDNPFLMGAPFIWCSNNLVVALATQCNLYHRLTGDSTYLEMEAALRDWLFGANPWGVSMVIGLPTSGTYAHDSHSAFSNLHGYPVDGGLLDGPVYGSIFRSLKYVALRETDEYAPFQSDLVVYHDDVGDYATNEATMDGTATLVPYLAALDAQGRFATPGRQQRREYQFSHGAIIRGDTTQKALALVFTGDEFADGGDTIRAVLKRHGAPASFFFTGNFYRNPAFAPLIHQLNQDGHLLGPHSDRHLLYCDWDNRDSLLVTRRQFETDMKTNLRAMQQLGIPSAQRQYFIPPFEWYNATISRWAQQMGLILFNFTPGTLSHADWTYPQLGRGYATADHIFDSILSFEKKQPQGLNGFILLSHIGADPRRPDKFYHHLDALLRHLSERGYAFKRIDALID
ncbi:MAG: glycoside hydrolase family 9 protein [Candidatus Zhuqueibacterota bacterium]